MPKLGRFRDLSHPKGRGRPGKEDSASIGRALDLCRFRLTADHDVPHSGGDLSAGIVDCGSDRLLPGRA